MRFVLLLPLSEPPHFPVLQFLGAENEMIEIIDFLIFDFPLLFDNFLHIGGLDIVAQVDVVLLLEFLEKLFHSGIHNLNPIHDDKDSDLVVPVAIVDEGLDILAHSCQGPLQH